MRILIVVLLTCSIVFAANTGTISGTVVEQNTGTFLPGANVSLQNTTFGAATDVNGQYTIAHIPPGVYKLCVQMMGYKAGIVDSVNVIADSTVYIDVELIIAVIEGEEVVVEAERARIMKDQTSSQSPAVHPFVMWATEPEFVSAKPATEIHNTEEYDRIYESGFFEVLQNPLSTFAADVDAASYGNARRFIMQDQIPRPDVVRSEEFINYFHYDYPQPDDGHPLSINLEYGECPWNSKSKLVHIGLRGKELADDEKKPSNLVFLIDVSGSMRDPNKLPLLKKSFKLLVNQLDDQDRIAMVVYASSTGLVLPATPGSEKRKILTALDKLSAGGSTAGGAGIQLAYKVAKDNLIKNGNNRVILATDGDFNVGISDTAELERFIESKRDDGIFLTVLGFGTGNYKDNRLQELADRGNGNHAYIDNIMEAKKVLYTELTSTLYTIAKDVKIQVEFNPAKIQSYRLIGYENRRLEDKDFEDDKKDAGEIGAGHTVTALYEVIPTKDLQNSKKLKYTETTITDDAKQSPEVLTVRIRYKEPDGKKSTEFTGVLQGEAVNLEESSDNFRFSAAVAEFAMLLRKSEFTADADMKDVLSLAKKSKGEDEFGYRAEFISIVNRAELLMEN